MLQLALAGLMALAVMQGATPAPMPNQCLSAEGLQATLSADLPQARLVTLPDELVAAFVAAFNDLPPKSDANADSVVIITMPGAPQAVLAFFRQGCLVGRAVLPVPLLDDVLRRLAAEA
jgi:hypothetical protein